MLPAADDPAYYKAFDHASNEVPTYDSTHSDDSNGEPFGVHSFSSPPLQIALY